MGTNGFFSVWAADDEDDTDSSCLTAAVDCHLRVDGVANNDFGPALANDDDDKDDGDDDARITKARRASLTTTLETLRLYMSLLNMIRLGQRKFSVYLSIGADFYDKVAHSRRVGEIICECFFPSQFFRRQVGSVTTSVEVKFNERGGRDR